MFRFTVEIDANGSYTEPLRRRLADYGISHGALARESGISATQLSRWFNTPIEPRLESIQRLEAAIEAILERRRLAGRHTKTSADGARERGTRSEDV